MPKKRPRRTSLVQDRGTASAWEYDEAQSSQLLTRSFKSSEEEEDMHRQKTYHPPTHQPTNPPAKPPTHQPTHQIHEKTNLLSLTLKYEKFPSRKHRKCKKHGNTKNEKNLSSTQIFFYLFSDSAISPPILMSCSSHTEEVNIRNHSWSHLSLSTTRTLTTARTL